MRLVKKGNTKELWKGTCLRCRSEFEADKSELNIAHCPREGYAYAKEKCTECGATFHLYKARNNHD